MRRIILFMYKVARLSTTLEVNQKQTLPGTDNAPRHQAAAVLTKDDHPQRHIMKTVQRKEQPPEKEKSDEDTTFPAEGALATTSVLDPDPC